MLQCSHCAKFYRRLTSVTKRCAKCSYLERSCSAEGCNAIPHPNCRGKCVIHRVRERCKVPSCGGVAYNFTHTLCRRHYLTVKTDYDAFCAAPNDELERRKCLRRTSDLIHYGEKKNK